MTSHTIKLHILHITYSLFFRSTFSIYIHLHTFTYKELVKHFFDQQVEIYFEKKVWELKVFKTLVMIAITCNHFIASTSEKLLKRELKADNTNLHSSLSINYSDPNKDNVKINGAILSSL